jgi:hypothetical protein
MSEARILRSCERAIFATGAIRCDPKYAGRIEMGHMALIRVIVWGHSAVSMPVVHDFLKINNSLAIGSRVMQCLAFRFF